MSPEFYAIVATGIALAGLILNNQRATAQLRNDMAELREQMHREIAALDEKLSSRIAALDEKLSSRIAALDEKLSRDIAALGERGRAARFMEGIRDAIAGKAA